MQNKLIIRKMSIDDVDNVASLEAQCFSHPWSRQAFLDALNNDYYMIYVAYLDDCHVGTACYTKALDEADISNVAVLDNCRQRGIAYLLLKELLNEGHSKGVNHFTLEVRRGNSPAIKLYEKLGFVSEGIRPKFYRDPEEDAVIMWHHDFGGLV